MRTSFSRTLSSFALAVSLAACTQPGGGGEAGGNGAAGDSNGAAAYGNDVYATYGVHNPPDASPCQSPDCSYAGQPGRPADPSYPPYWQSPWTMYIVSAGYETNPPPYKGAPPAGTTYRRSSGASYYDSTWRGKSGEGAMMEYYDKRCLPIFPFTPIEFTCAFISLGDTAYFLTYPQDRPKGMPPVCLFSPLNHPPRRDFIKHLPWAKGDSERLGGGAQGYSFWIDGNPDSPTAGKVMQVGASPDGTAKGWILFGYAFAPVNGKMQPQSFYFSGFPATPPDAPIVSQNYTDWKPTKPDPAKTWNLVAGLDPAKLPACTVMNGPTDPKGAPLKAMGQRPPTWFDLGKMRRKRS
jgi:hypothetical protein